MPACSGGRVARGLRECPRARRGSARWGQRLTKRPPSASRLFLCELTTPGPAANRGGTVSWWVGPGWAAARSLEIWPLGKKTAIFFPPFSASLLRSFFSPPFTFLKATIFVFLARVLVRVTVAGGPAPAGRGPRGSSLWAWARSLRRVPVGSVKWALTIAATCQPTSQGCCGDAARVVVVVVAEMVSVARSPGAAA